MILLKLYILSTLFTTWYAWSRSMHDKQLFGTQNYKWHWWALQEAIVLNSVFILGLYLLVSYNGFHSTIALFKLIALWFANAFFFWIIFDMLMGWHAVKDIWYIGIIGFDKQVRKVFLYERFKGKAYFIFKLMLWMIITLGIYFEINLNDLF